MWRAETYVNMLYRASSQITDLWIASPELKSLDFESCAHAQFNRDSNVLFVGPLETACKYLTEQQKLYKVQLIDAKLMNGFENYDELCMMSPLLGRVMYRTEMANRWSRSSDSENDFKAFSKIEQNLSDCDGIDLRGGYKNFHDELVIFKGANIIITPADEKECDQILNDAFNVKRQAPSSAQSKKKSRRMEPIRVT